MGTNSGIDVKNLNAVFSCVCTYNLLVHSIFLIATSGVGVEGKKGTAYVIHVQAMFFQGFNYVGSTKIPGYAGIYQYIDYVAWLYLRSVGMLRQNFFN